MASRTANIQAGTRQDLKDVYLAIYDAAIVIDIPDIASKLKLERRYANELVATLQVIKDDKDQPLVIINTQAGEENNDTPHDWYQATESVDYQSREEAEARFDAAVPDDTGSDKPESRKGSTKVYNPTKATNGSNPADLPGCRCGCGFPVNSRNRNYLPGHDARHAGQVARAMAEFPGKDNEDKRASLLDALPTDALRWKAAAMADRLIAKGQPKDTVNIHDIVDKVSKDFVQPVTFTSGMVKVGRWSYPAERNDTSGAVSYTQKEEVKVATDKIAASFIANEEQA